MKPAVRTVKLLVREDLFMKRAHRVRALAVDVGKGLCVHPQWGLSARVKVGYMVTHISSGRRVAGPLRTKDALRRALAVLLTEDWTKVKYPAPERLKNLRDVAQDRARGEEAR